MRSAWRSGLVLLLALGLVVAGGAAAVVWVDPGPPGPLRGGADPVSAPTTEVAFTDPRRVTARFSFDAGHDLLAPRAGRVTDAGVCADGAPITSGAPVVALDERPVTALHTSTPLWRDLVVGTRGADVRGLQEELSRLGHRVTADGVYGATTHRAVRRLLAGNGVAVGTRAPLSVADLLWVPEVEVAGLTCAVALGSVVAEGDVVATSGSTLRGVEVTEVPAGRVPGERELDLGVLRVRTDEDGMLVDPAALAALDGSELVRILLEQDEPTAPDLDWTLVTPVEATGVPPRALHGLRAGRGCVSHAGTAYEVTVVSSSLGTTLVVSADDRRPPPAVDLDPGSGPCG
ncbi:peptidoglycan-binding domain-containing protein [Cellulomonas triticagri]|uniref:Peptidoglycan-binding protein n=1 Tax=Cellulomonas triticagri TaxID=2483352 RepID=A0A3M2J7W5_9CELL|nr:peptidoglycan-binding domain-containing protein [Cellulomonas triticagri]RMI06578.1 peptidoglycan-binding protein [Cellulomonas triticagri]